MVSKNQELKSVIPDLQDLSPDQRAALGNSALAHSLALYIQRLEDNGELLSAFNSMIKA